MEELYDRIMKKPKAYRRKLAYIITAIFGVLIFSLWMFMTFDNFQNVIQAGEKGSNLRNSLPSLKEKYQQESEEEKIKNQLEDLGY